jgi:hypothetical protein
MSSAKIARRFARSRLSHLPEEGWAGKKNGELLSLTETRGFQIFLTLDRGLVDQQNLRGRAIAIVWLRAQSSRLADRLPKIPEMSKALSSAQPGQVIKVG